MDLDRPGRSGEDRRGGQRGEVERTARDAGEQSARQDDFDRRDVEPDALPERLDTVLLAVKTQHTRAALAQIAPRLAGCVVSLQNGLNEPVIAEAVGAARTVGAFVNFGADYVAPGRIHYAGRGTFVVGELDGRHSPRVAALARDLGAEVTDNVVGYLWAKAAYGAMLFATAVSDLTIEKLILKEAASGNW